MGTLCRNEQLIQETKKTLGKPEALKAAKIKASKEDRKNTTGIKLNDRITWWAEMNGES